jgi:hypothetical protein
METPPVRPTDSADTRDVTTSDVTTSDVTTSDVVEHVMRLTGDDFSVLAFLTTAPGSREALAALGRLGPHAGVSVGSPLFAWCTLSSHAPLWRASVPAGPATLWAELEDLRAVFGPRPAAHAYDELCQLRDASAELLG